MARGDLGAMMTPGQGNRLPPFARWGADNGVYAGKFPGVERWLAWLVRILGQAPDAPARALFAVAPDVLHRLPDGTVIGDAAATLEQSAPVLPRIRELGIPAALVAQDGLEALTVPWDAFDVLFLGGSTAWKLGPASQALTRQALARGKRVHMGRVSSLKRWSHAHHRGIHTCDGTFISKAPDRRLPEALGWRTQQALFTEETA